VIAGAVASGGWRQGGTRPELGGALPGGIADKEGRRDHGRETMAARFLFAVVGGREASLARGASLVSGRGSSVCLDARG
jgi:hypothetical protein